MNPTGRIWLAALGMAPWIFPGSASALVIDFEDLAYAPGLNYENGANLPEDYYDDDYEYTLSHYESQGAVFQNMYYPPDHWFYVGGLWHGWAYSKETNTANPGYDNSYSSATGTGAGGSSSYALLYHADFMGPDFTGLTSFVQLPTGYDQPVSLSFCTTAWSLAYMQEKFPSTAFEMKMIVKALGHGLEEIASKEVILGNADGVVSEWTELDLSEFGNGVEFLDFTLESNDTKSGFMNPPAYVAIDNINVIPEPSTYALFAGLAALGVVVIRRRRQELPIWGIGDEI